LRRKIISPAMDRDGNPFFYHSKMFVPCSKP